MGSQKLITPHLDQLAASGVLCSQGYVASLLTQERPNVFTQAVANIEPGRAIEVRLHYLNTLPYHDGSNAQVRPRVLSLSQRERGGPAKRVGEGDLVWRAQNSVNLARFRHRRGKKTTAPHPVPLPLGEGTQLRGLDHHGNSRSRN